MRKEDQETARPGDILLFYNAGGLAKLITWFTRSRFYHVAIYDDGQVIESRPRGVVRRALREDERFQVIRAPDGSGAAALSWAGQQVGSDYDVFAVVVMILERLFENLRLNYKSPSNKFSCCDFVICAFQEAGVDLLPGQNPATAVPADFARLLPRD